MEQGFLGKMGGFPVVFASASSVRVHGCGSGAGRGLGLFGAPFMVCINGGEFVSSGA